MSPGLTPKRRVRRGKLSEARRQEPEVALRSGPDGIVETIPLTREILLNPIC